MLFGHIFARSFAAFQRDATQSARGALQSLRARIARDSSSRSAFSRIDDDASYERNFACQPFTWAFVDSDGSQFRPAFACVVETHSEEERGEGGGRKN